mmetsp:Transcript_24847/g.36459  ORF Transcript_24847/g.36459 Transcript_24847/m.36459 type:complete len:313 (+) Transcript_24847:37-975(+)
MSKQKRLIFTLTGLALLALVTFNIDYVKIAPRRRQGEIRFARRGYIQGNLGNRLFAVASTIGIARANGLEPCIEPKLKKDDSLKQFKNIPYCPGEKGNATVWDTPVYYGPLKKLGVSDDVSDIETIGYGQSYRYFEDVQEEVVNAFKLNNLLQDQSREFMKDYKDSIKVGIHVRRTDMIAFGRLYGGYPKKGFFVNGMRTMRKKYGPSVKFFVATDDLEWCKQQSFFRTKDVFFIERDAIGDFGILRECDHMIIGLGTYGWWSAYLGAHQKGGDVIYFQKDQKNPPKNKHFNAVDFYLPTWVSVSDYVTQVK